jgi:hypothetical protein
LRNIAFVNECKGQLHVVKWLLNREPFERRVDTAFGVSCAYARLEIARWIANKFKLNKKDHLDIIDDAFQLSCKAGNPHAAKWLVNRFGLTADDIRLWTVLREGSFCATWYSPTIA